MCGALPCPSLQAALRLIPCRFLKALQTTRYIYMWINVIFTNIFYNDLSIAYF